MGSCISESTVSIRSSGQKIKTSSNSTNVTDVPYVSEYTRSLGPGIYNNTIPIRSCTKTNVSLNGLYVTDVPPFSEYIRSVHPCKKTNAGSNSTSVADVYCKPESFGSVRHRGRANTDLYGTNVVNLSHNKLSHVGFIPTE